MNTSILLKFYVSTNTSSEFQVGALLEDYVNYSNKESFPEPIIEGYNHQQHVSSVFVNHPAYLKSEKLLDCKLRKNSDKIIPMFYDHFLRTNWDTISDVSFEAFQYDLMLSFSEKQEYIPYKYNRLLNSIYKKSWYNALQTIGGTHGIMMQQTKRFTFNTNLEHSINSLIEHYSEHRVNFFEILPDLQKASFDFVNSKRELVYS